MSEAAAPPAPPLPDAPKKKRMGSLRPPASIKGTKRSQKTNVSAKRWDLIRCTFCYDPTTSLKELARKHGVAYNTIQKRSSDERWGELRAEALDAQGKDIQKRLAVRLADQMEPTILEAFTQIRSLRQKALQYYEEQIDPNATLPVSSDQVIQVRREKGVLTKTTAKRVRPRLDSNLIQTLVKIEQRYLEIMSGYGGRGDGDKTVTIE